MRDLAWAIGSPGLLDEAYPSFGGQIFGDGACSASLARATNWLLALDRTPDTLHEFLNERPVRRLGRYFERLIEFWLRHAEEFRLLRAHLPVRRGKHTLGEFDFILEGPTGPMHWETAVKFYLHAAPHEAWDTFLGPSTVDRLDIKLNRVFDHQLKLKDLPESAVAFKGAADLTPLAFIKGYLFYPPDQLAGEATLSPGVSPRHLGGWWMRLDAQEWPRKSPAGRWRVLPRLQWLAPSRANIGEELLDAGQMRREVERLFAIRPEPLLLAELARSRGAWQEVQRGFVVPTGWPFELGASR